ncbi:BRCT domain-containing protein [Anaerotignum sp.]|uniref:BRCT domain-containing protein n=1 Tax=Anaerotignum sp. TaxID=2039241 RepID=UPI002A918807|nr:BRCT domain-containing protein [Anaerotignum sp.]MCI7656641.1 BRCT domain-containing protein [Clostridia bacterium]MDY5414664.1 BRCT domain-containing protein [Anaerotignum sp.]
MANISSASGKITLKGDWTQEAIAALELVLDMWEFYGEYGIQSYDGFDEEHQTSDFFGCGRWSFSGTLDSFEDWTRDWLKEKPKRPNGELIHSLTEEQYENFLKIMCEKNLVIEMDFEDVEEGCGGHIHEIGQFTSEDGSCIRYETLECENVIPSWDEYERSSLEAAVDFFENFLSDVNRKKLRKWVKNYVTPTDIFENTDDYWEIIEYFGDCGEDPFIEFFLKFSPDTEDWEEFNLFYEEMWGCTVEEDIDEGYGEDLDFYDDDDDDDDEDVEDDDEDRDVNTWDTEPQYPLDEIDALEISGSAFVLTGDFQNCDGDRDEVKKMIEEKGGRCTGAVSGKTNYLVLGDFGSVGAKKIDQVMEQRAKGKDIKIIAEYDLFRFL